MRFKGVGLSSLAIVLLTIGLGCTAVWPSRTYAQEIAVTFDDLPAHAPLPKGTSRIQVASQILAALKEAEMPEVYGFINAEKVEEVPEDIAFLKLWRQTGQPLANHTYSHMNLNENTAEAFEESIAKNEPLLRDLMDDREWHWFRYPYLFEGETLEKRRAVRGYLREHGYRIAQVTMDFEDYLWNGPYARCSEKGDEKAIAWLKESYLKTAAEYMELDKKMAEQIFHRPIKHILLLHVGAFDALMLPQLLQQIKKQGYKFVTLEEAASDAVFQTDPDAALKNGGTLLDQIFDSKHLPYPQHSEKPMKKLQELCQ
jgi:peptidoglycan/xylan/chitin deacetylase (PgdA/CDA1 family)